MASISGTTSNLGNTTLRGFGGLASGIDRDSIIEQMSLASTTKIQNQKKAITSLTWKQEAFRSVINQILDLQDNYLSYAASKNVTDPGLYAKSVITANGDKDVTKYISASGSSEMLEYLAVRGVEQLASAANVQSGSKEVQAFETTMGYDTQARTSNLEGTKLIFGLPGNEANKGKFVEKATLTLPSSYKDENGKTVTVDYTQEDLGKLAEDLNKAIVANEFKITNEITVQFEHDTATDSLKMKYVSLKPGIEHGGKYEIDETKDQEAADFAEKNGFVIRSNSSALKALGFKKDDLTKEEAEKAEKDGGYKLDSLNAAVSNTKDSYVKVYDNMADYLKGKKFTVTYGGQTKEIELLSEKDAEALADASVTDKNAALAEKMQANLDKAFGSGKIVVSTGTDGSKLSFHSKDESTTLSINSKSSEVMKQTGLETMNSNKISLEGSLWNNREKLGFDKNISEEDFQKQLDNFQINGVTIGGLTKDTTVNQLLNKINSSDAGVKATYLNTSNKFILTRTETGTGREIDVAGADNGAATIFGGPDAKNEDGKDAVMWIDYGTGAEKVVSSTNTFDLDGLKVTVSGTFGVEENADGTVTRAADGTTPKFDTSKAVTFNASADVDKATESVKKFIEDYNELVKEINKHITTKPDSDYGPLTDQQKDEMNETSIENWEKKAKEGLLYNNSIMRDLSQDMQGVLNQLLGSVSYDDLEEIGISMSDDPYDGGTLKFDEEKFKTAMKDDPEKVSDIFTGSGDVKKGLTSIVDETLKKYATRYRYLNKDGSYGRLVEEAGSERISLSLQENTIYKQLKDMQENLSTLQTRLKSEQDRYIKQFTLMEQAISNMNSQSSYLSSLTG